MHLNKISSLIEKLGLTVVCILSGCIAFWLSVVSLLHTVTVEDIKEGEGITSSLYYIMQYNESVIYYNDNFFMNIIYLLLSIAVIYFLSVKFAEIKLEFKLLFLFLWTFFLGTIWVISSQSAPNTDSECILMAASEFSQDNYRILHEWIYFKEYSFQLGYVFFCEIIMRVVNSFSNQENFLYLEVINALLLGVINVFIVKICDLTIKDKKVSTAVTIMIALSCAPIISCSFIYGIYPGMMFAIIALYFELRYLMEDNKICGIMSVIYIGIAVTIKSNYLIWLIAMVLIAGVMMLKRRNYLFDSILMIVAVIISLSVQPAVKKMYENRSGVKLGDSIPYSAWIAMGLNESQSAPGWFNYTFTTEKYENNNSNAVKTGKESKKIIIDRIKKFTKEPQYTNDFFYKKVVSQWNETSYESIWSNVVRFQYKDRNALAEWVCNKGDNKVKKYMDIWTQLLFYSFTVGILMTMRKRDFLAVSLAVIFLGGFFYQLISEGKSQYIIPYIIVMTGIAGCGIKLSGDFLLKKYKELKAYFKDEKTCSIGK